METTHPPEVPVHNCPGAKLRRALLVFPLLLVAMPAAAQQRDAVSREVGSTTEVAASARRRAPDGKPAVLAAAASSRIRIDGALDEDIWSRAEPASDFVQSEPKTGAPATERTEVRVAYDEANLYISAYLHDADPRGPVINDIRKDFKEDDQDTFEIILDTFDDRQNGYVFIVNAAGARADKQVANEGRETNASWDGLWSVATRRVADGWTAEIAIPFRSLRFATGDGQWGVNFSRRLRRKNEIDFWSPVPRSYTLARLSLAGHLTGLSLSNSGRDLRVKPFALTGTTRETGGDHFVQKADAGIDLKYGLTSGLTLDATARPDFAQAEADEQQVNLTQFSQFFPEKRDFFLENSGIFYVGDAARNKANPSPTPDEDMLLFFSRRIGLTSSGYPIPIDGGIRVTGREAGFGIGALSMETRPTTTTARTNYSVARLRRGIAPGTDVGTVFMQRVSESGKSLYNRVGGIDANIRLWGKIDWNSYGILSRSDTVSSKQFAARSTMLYEGNFLHVKTGMLTLGDGFSDDLGFYRRIGVRKYLLDAGIRPRPAWAQAIGIRELHPHVTWDYFTNQKGVIQAKKLHTGWTVFFADGGYHELSWNPNSQRIAKPFAINPTVGRIPVGTYDWTEYMLKGQTDLSKPVSVVYQLVTGGLWSGTQKTASVSTLIRPGYRFRISLGGQATHAELPAPSAAFTTSLWTMRANYSFTTNMFVDALSQYEPHQRKSNANIRFNLIHHPLSDLFIVYNDQRVFVPDGATEIAPGRSLIVKFTQMMAF